MGTQKKGCGIKTLKARCSVFLAQIKGSYCRKSSFNALSALHFYLPSCILLLLSLSLFSRYLPLTRLVALSQEPDAHPHPGPGLHTQEWQSLITWLLLTMLSCCHPESSASLPALMGKMSVLHPLCSGIAGFPQSEEVGPAPRQESARRVSAPAIAVVPPCWWSDMVVAARYTRAEQNRVFALCFCGKTSLNEM